MVTNSLSRKKLSILIADDIRETRRSTRLMLAEIPNVDVVAMANNGQQAVEMVKEHHPDIVIMDVSMPELDGVAAYKEIRQIYPEIGCIMMSGQYDISTVRDVMKAGAQEYLLKPFTVNELSKAIARLNERIAENRQKLVLIEQEKQKEAALKQLAEEYIAAQRSDEQALRVFEQLVEYPECELRWLQTLATVYIYRKEWGKLKDFAAKMEQQ
jgi:two-component system, chemotaxis family, chemotaxis protein CheY